MFKFSFRSVFLSVPVFFFLVISVSCNRTPEKSGNQLGVVQDSTDHELDNLTNAVIKHPKDQKVLLERAAYYLRHELFNEALQDVNRALELNDKNAAVYLTLSDIYLYSGKTQRALDALKKAASLNPGDADVDVKMARLYLTMTDYKQTFNSLRSALKKDPENAEAFFISGLANEEIGDTAKAIDSYQMAVARDQKHYDALKQLGILYSIKKNKLAIDYLRNASQLKPDQPDPLYVLGMYYQDTDNPDKAISVYNEILQIDSTFKLAWYNRGYVELVYKNEFAKAVQSFSKALELDGNYPEALYNRGYAYELLGDKKHARSDYEQVLRMRVNDDKAIEGLNRLDNE